MYFNRSFAKRTCAIAKEADGIAVTVLTEGSCGHEFIINYSATPGAKGAGRSYTFLYLFLVKCLEDANCPRNDCVLPCGSIAISEPLT